jgi:hypothetical protein
MWEAGRGMVEKVELGRMEEEKKGGQGRSEGRG